MATSTPSTKELHLTRVFNAPLDVVYAAWTQPTQLAQWFAPYGFTIPVCELDVRAGGSIHIQMEDQAGNRHPMDGTYLEVVPAAKLMFTSAALDGNGNEALTAVTTVTFSDYQGKTTVSVRARVENITDAGVPMLAGMRAGWTQTLQKLESHVQDETQREIVLNRLIQAPQELVFEAFTKPEHLMKWFGPKGFTITMHEADIRPGGVWLFTMHGPDGTDWPNKVTYKEIVPHELITYMHGSGNDEDGNNFNVTIRMEPMGSFTILTMRTVFNTSEQCEFTKGFGAVELGNQSMAKLEEHVLSLRA